MSSLIHCHAISKSFGTTRLFHALTFGVRDQDHIGIIGPNGSGKSTLLAILAGLEQADQGTVTRRQHLRMAYIPQQTTFPEIATVGDVIEQAALDSGIPREFSLGTVQETLGRFGFEDGNQPVAPLSGGWKKRLAIACGFVQHPDVMLLDEPTNHLDLEGIHWLAQLMAQTPWAWVMVSHDRWCLELAANTVAEIHPRYPDGIFQVKGAYTEFVRQREAFQVTQIHHVQALAGKERREEEWLRRGPKARTTKAKYRINKAHELQAELSETTARLRQDSVAIDFVGSGRKTRQLIQARNLGRSIPSGPLFQNLDLVLSPGTRLGVVGRNGSGKTTLLKLLAKELEPDEGTVIHADNLQLLYFDQHRQQLNRRATLRHTLSDNGHTVTYRGQTIQLAGWAKRFRFQSEQLDLPIALLSGGEQARAMIARLMLQPADVLIIDEPTNDLDIPTREVLEDSIEEFPGAIVLVTHDRYMLTTLCTQFVGLDGRGACGFFAEYEQWERWLRHSTPKPTHTAVSSPTSNASARQTKPKKLSYREQQEYDTMEQRILEAELALETGRAAMENPAIASDHIQIQQAYDALKAAEQDVERLYARWAELEAKKPVDRQSVET